MRAVRTLVLAALIAALAVATPDPLASRRVAQSMSHKPAEMTEALHTVKRGARPLQHVRQAAHALHSNFNTQRRVQAQQATQPCDPVGFADATATVLQACPSLSGLVSGATSMVEFLPGFCGSECYNALATALVQHVGCLNADTLFLVAMVETCQTRPQCFSEPVVVAQARLETQCANQLSALADITNFTAAAVADARAACSGSCVTDQVALFRSNPECMVDPTTGAAMNARALAAVSEHMCTTENGEVCGVQLKAVGELSCDEASVCRASSRCDANCNPQFSASVLGQLCGTCSSGLMPHLEAFGESASAFAAGLQVMCTTKSGGAASETNPYCIGSTMTALAMMSAQGTTAATMCAADAEVCVPKMISLIASQSKLEAEGAFKMCLLMGSSSQQACLTTFEASLRGAATTGAIGRLLCAKNRASTPRWCYDDLMGYLSLSSSCPAEPAAMLTQSGCCLPLINDAVRMMLPTFPATYLPSGQRTIVYNMTSRAAFTYTHTSLYARTSLDRSVQPMAGVVACAGNTTEQWTLVESSCPPVLSTRPSASMPVTLAWERVSANPALKARVEASLRADVAVAAGVGPDQIVNAQLVQGTGTVQLRAASRRQASTGANCQFTFEVDGATEAEATAAAATFEQKKTAGTLVTASTAATVQSECTECMDARSTSLVNAAAPAPTPAPPPAPVSSASGVAAAATAVVAALVAALAL